MMLGCDNMEMLNIIIAILCLINVVIITFKFFASKRVSNDETRIYGYLLLAMLAESIAGIALFLTMKYSLEIIHFFNGLYLSTMTIWVMLFSLYMIRISESSDKKYSVIRIAFIVLSLITIVGSFILPRDIASSDKNELYATGPAIMAVYLYSGICLSAITFYLAKNIKRIRDKRYLPVLVLLIGCILLMMIQSILPELFLFTPVESYIVFIMFFTIENPDVKMLIQVRDAKDQAEKANRAKTDFLSSMSHEIRTPLNAIVGLSEDNLTYQEKLPVEVIENSKDIISASQTLLEIVGNILDINKIEANKMEIVEGIYNFKEEIVKMCKVTATRIGEKNVHFTLSIARDIPYELVGDKSKVKTIINNLLSNAIKYTDEGEVNLNIKCINDINHNKTNLMITCQDTGKGIKAEMVNRLFNKFDRLEVERNTTVEGTGLGLAITKSLVDMMGGTINVQSQYGKGSIFVVQLPQTIHNLTAPSEITETVTHNQNNQTTYGHKKILVVDDNKLNIKVAMRALKDFDFEIDEALEGQECLDKINSGKNYDLILMDIMMPHMSGNETLKRLKDNPTFDTPVIALTADAVAGATEKYLELGFTEYIAKPFTKEQIKEKLDKIFNS